MTQQEIKEVSENAKTIVNLDVMEFLKTIESKAKEWQTKLKKDN